MRRSAPWLTALLQTVILFAVVGFATPWLDADQTSLPIPRRSGDITLNGPQPRPLYSGSVVPGGVYSIDELRAAIARDPIVAAHYGHINLAEMRVVTLTTPRSAYVSYRRGDRTYWTRDRVRLKAGETVLTDGATTIRARCGNCVSDVKQERVAVLEPAHGELDDFVVPATADRGVDAIAAEAEARLGDLLEVPLAPELLASLQPGDPPPVADALDDGTDERLSPFFGVPLLGRSAGGGGVPGRDVPRDGSFVPAGDTTLGGVTTGEFSNGDSSTGSGTTGNPTGSVTGQVTSGTTTSVSVAASTGTTPAPEPGSLWLVAAGLVGLASRRVRKA